MNLTKIFNRSLGGKARARIMQAATVVAFIAALVLKIDWNLPLGVLVPTIVQTIAHDTKVGD